MAHAWAEVNEAGRICRSYSDETRGFLFSNFYVCPTVNVYHSDFCACDFSEKLSILGR